MLYDFEARYTNSAASLMRRASMSLPGGVFFPFAFHHFRHRFSGRSQPFCLPASHIAQYVLYPLLGPKMHIRRFLSHGIEEDFVIRRPRSAISIGLESGDSRRMIQP